MSEAPARAVSSGIGTADELFLRLLSSLDPEHTLQAVVDSAALLSGAPFASIWIRTDGRYHPVASHRIPLAQLESVRFPAADSPIVHLFDTGEPMEVVGYDQHAAASEAGKEILQVTGVQTMLGLPLRVDGSVEASLWISKAEALPFPANTLETLQRLVSYAEVALANATRFSGVEAERGRLQSYIDSIPEAVIVYDHAGVVQMLNRSFEQTFNVRQSLIGIKRTDLDAVFEATGSRRLHRRYDEDTVFERVIERGEAEQGLIEIDDPPRAYEAHFSPVRNRLDEVEAIVATVRDITDPLDLARERSRANLLAQLLDLSAQLNSDLSVQALTERVVEAAMAMLGTKTGALGLIEGDRLIFRRFHTPEGWVDFDASVAKGESGPGHVWEIEAPYVSNACHEDPYVLQAVRARMKFERLVYVPLFNRSGTIIGALGVYDPVVDRDFGQGDVETLQLLANQVSIAIENARLNEMKDSFLSIVSHELKTPVTSIKGFAQVMRRRLSPESQETAGRFLDIINNQTDRLTTLINDLLDLSRIQTGRFQFDIRPIDYADLIREVSAEMQLIGPRNPLQLHLPESVWVLGNADRLRQVLVNLIDNAMKHGPEDGPVRITIEVEGDEVRTFVCDQGPGLPPGEAERIFGPYYQVPQTGASPSRGLGLGLFISRQIIEGHQGRIWLDPDDHTSFCFSVPRAS